MPIESLQHLLFVVNLKKVNDLVYTSWNESETLVRSCSIVYHHHVEKRTIQSRPERKLPLCSCFAYFHLFRAVFMFKTLTKSVKPQLINLMNVVASRWLWTANWRDGPVDIISILFSSVSKSRINSQNDIAMARKKILNFAGMFCSLKNSAVQIGSWRRHSEQDWPWESFENISTSKAE